MSIENNLQRIADALEVIAKVAQGSLQSETKAVTQPAAATPEPVTPEPAAVPPAPAAAAPATPPPPVTPAAAAPTPAAPAPAAQGLTVQQLNDELYKHYVRLGNDRAPIDKVMQEQFGVMSINNLKPEQYQRVLDAVAQLQKSAAPTPAAPNGLG